MQREKENKKREGKGRESEWRKKAKKYKTEIAKNGAGWGREKAKVRGELKPNFYSRFGGTEAPTIQCQLLEERW